MSVYITVPCTIANVESHSHLSPGDVFAVAFNMAHTKGLQCFQPLHVNNSVNGHRSTALSTIESKKPAFAATVAVKDAKSA